MFGRLGGRSRWAAVGAVVAVLVGAGGLLTASAASSPGASSFVPITPCRLFDTRAGSDNVGTRSTPIGADETFVVPVWGTNGNCTIPTGATGVSLSVTLINPSAASYLTVFPSNAARPLTSNLNWVAGQAPTPNAVTAPLSADGRMSLYNLTGTVDLLVDIVGFYEPASSGPVDVGPDPAQIVWVAKSGGDFTTLSAALASITDNSAAKPYLIKIAPGVYTETSWTALKNYVDIEGSGQDITTITCACATASSSYLSAVLAAAGPDQNVEVRHLTVANTGGGTWSVAVGTESVTSGVSFVHVNATATGIGTNFAFFFYGSGLGSGSAPTLTNVTAIATGGVSTRAVYVATLSPSTFTNLTATAAGASSDNTGVMAFSDVLIRDSTVSGTNQSVVNAIGTTRIANTVVNGVTDGVGGGKLRQRADHRPRALYLRLTTPPIDCTGSRTLPTWAPQTPVGCQAAGQPARPLRISWNDLRPAARDSVSSASCVSLTSMLIGTFSFTGTLASIGMVSSIGIVSVRSIGTSMSTGTVTSSGMSIAERAVDLDRRVERFSDRQRRLDRHLDVAVDDDLGLDRRRPRRSARRTRSSRCRTSRDRRSPRRGRPRHVRRELG